MPPFQVPDIRKVPSVPAHNPELSVHSCQDGRLLLSDCKKTVCQFLYFLLGIKIAFRRLYIIRTQPNLLIFPDCFRLGFHILYPHNVVNPEFCHVFHPRFGFPLFIPFHPVSVVPFFHAAFRFCLRFCSIFQFPYNCLRTSYNPAPPHSTDYTHKSVF